MPVYVSLILSFSRLIKSINFSSPDARQCLDRPCFPQVQCTDVELRDVLRTPNWRTLSIIKLFRCGDCPQGYEGDGEVCRSKYRVLGNKKIRFVVLPILDGVIMDESPIF